VTREADPRYRAERCEPARRALAAAAARWAHARPDRWAPVPPELDRAIAADRALAEAAREARRGLYGEVSRRLAGLLPAAAMDRLAEALLEVPRERFVLPEDIASSADDAPSPLDRAGLATVSAPHAYLLTYALLGLAEGEHLLELGSGTGYGAALASHVLGARGRVTSIEIDPDLHARAVRLLRDVDSASAAPVTLLAGDARALAADRMTGPEPLRVVFTYAIAAPPEALLARLPAGARLLAPVGAGEDDQRLERWSRDERVAGHLGCASAGVVDRSEHGAVRYVPERR
jgi:protein-L-isoaspartate(D-aspartate) O-methyltransferase